jgi:hypothetical protein
LFVCLNQFGNFVTLFTLLFLCSPMKRSRWLWSCWKQWISIDWVVQVTIGFLQTTNWSTFIVNSWT